MELGSRFGDIVRMNNVSVNIAQQIQQVQQIQQAQQVQQAAQVQQTQQIQPSVEHAAAAARATAEEQIALNQFNANLGITHATYRLTERMPLQQRATRSLQQEQQPTGRTRRRGSSNTSASSEPDEYEDEGLSLASEDLIEALRQGDKAQLLEKLEGKYDALEEHTLLLDALSLLENMDMDPEEKAQLMDELEQMLADLLEQYGDAIEAGAQTQEQFETLVGKMDMLSRLQGSDDGQSLADLRAAYGGSEDGTDTPLTPLSLAKMLQDQFGADNFSAALGDLRSQMAGVLRDNPPSFAGPRMWLSFGDAACFNALQTIFALAGDLRTELWERAAVIARADQTTAALALLSAAESGSTQADLLAGKLADMKELDPMRAALLFMALYRTVLKMPDSMWAEEVLEQRLALLEELKMQAGSKFRRTHERDEAGDLEEKLRCEQREGRGQGGGGDQDEEEQQDKEEEQGERRKKKWWQPKDKRPRRRGADKL